MATKVRYTEAVNTAPYLSNGLTVVEETADHVRVRTPDVGYTGACAPTAFAAAGALPYATAVDRLNHIANVGGMWDVTRGRKSAAKRDVRWATPNGAIQVLVDQLGLVRVSGGRMLVGTFRRRFPHGNFLVWVAGHAFAVVNGRCVDLGTQYCRDNRYVVVAYRVPQRRPRNAVRDASIVQLCIERVTPANIAVIHGVTAKRVRQIVRDAKRDGRWDAALAAMITH